jgi:hypothetical protein
MALRKAVKKEIWKVRKLVHARALLVVSIKVQGKVFPTVLVTALSMDWKRVPLMVHARKSVMAQEMG